MLLLFVPRDSFVAVNVEEIIIVIHMRQISFVHVNRVTDLCKASIVNSYSKNKELHMYFFWEIVAATVYQH